MSLPTEQQSTTKSFIEKIKELKSSTMRNQYSPIPNDQYLKLLRTLSKDIAEIAYQGEPNYNQLLIDIKKHDKHRDISNRIYMLGAMYRANDNAIKSFFNEDKQIKRLEREAHTRNIIARAATTLVIGFSIMIVYWVAHELKIPMPMLKLATG